MIPRQGAQITKASHFDYEYVLGHKIVFLCVAKGKPRPTIVWYKDGRELFNHHYLHVSLSVFSLLVLNIISPPPIDQSILERKTSH